MEELGGGDFHSFQTLTPSRLPLLPDSSLTILMKNPKPVSLHLYLSGARQLFLPIATSSVNTHTSNLPSSLSFPKLTQHTFTFISGSTILPNLLLRLFHSFIPCMQSVLEWLSKVFQRPMPVSSCIIIQSNLATFIINNNPITIRIAFLNEIY